MGLTQAAPRFWNEIAETQSLQTKWAQRVFPMCGEDQIAEEDKDYYALVKKGASKTVAGAAVYLKPLLLEQSAISRYLEETNGYWLRAALPELNSINEAVLLATAEFRLNQSQQRRLTKLLKEMIEKEQTGQQSSLTTEKFLKEAGERAKKVLATQPDIPLAEKIKRAKRQMGLAPQRKSKPKNSQP